MNDKTDSQTIEKQEEHKVETCLTCVHLGDDQHCERIECWEFSGWSATRKAREE